MPWFKISYLTVGSLAFAMVGGLLTYYLLKPRNKSRLTWLLAGYVGFATLLALSYIFCFSVLAPFAVVYYFGAQAMIFGVVFLVYFAYRFPRNLHPRAARIVPTVYFAAATIAYAYDSFRAPQTFAYLPTSHRYSFDSTLVLTIVLALGIVLTIFTFLRNAALMSDYAGRLLQRKEESRPPRYVRWLATFIIGGVVWIMRILKPGTRDARSARSFAIVTTASFLISLSFVLVHLKFISEATFAQIFDYGALGTVLGYFVVYTNSSPEYSSFRQKLVGVTLATLMVTLGLVGSAMYKYVDISYDAQNLGEATTTAQSLAQGHRASIPSSVAYAVSPPTISRQSHYIVWYTTKPALTAGVFGRSDILWEKLKERNSSVVEPNGRRHFRLFDVRNPSTFYDYYDVKIDNRTYEVGFSYLNYREIANGVGLRLVVIELLGGILVLILLPLFFRQNVTKPLEELHRGVEAVDAGDLSVHVPVRFNDEIGYLAGAFNRMVVSVKRSDRLKDEFLANISHELRTPVNGFVGLAEAMLDGSTGELSLPAQRNLELISSSGRRLVSLVNDLLDFSRLKVMDIELNLTVVDVRTIADVVLALSQPLVSRKHIELRNEVPADLCVVRGDDGRLQQILHNLVGNAIKFTESGAVTIEATEAGDFVKITVADTGTGIAAGRLQDIFKPFEQADASIAREYGGTGLGLAITQQLVVAHGGSIQAESAEGRGSRFSFTIPRAADETTAPPPAAGLKWYGKPVVAVQSPLASDAVASSRLPTNAPEMAANGRYRILAVDDEPVNQQVLANQLGLEHFEVVPALSGTAALELLDRERFDLVLLDVMMPRMSGYEVCSRIRDRFPPTELPIIVLTAKNLVEDLVQGFDVGANDFLSKPATRQELLSRVRTHLRLAKINAASGRFVPREFLQVLDKESIVDVRIGDHVQGRMAVLFSDIRSFTKLSESMSPEDNFGFINAYLKHVVPVIEANQGFVDKYVGDAVMAIFPKTPENAIRAAIQMQRELYDFNQDRAKKGYQPVETGIGIHSGSLMLGTIGTEERMQGTVISDAVNLASRIQDLTKAFGARILVSTETVSGLEQTYSHRLLGMARVKGKKSVTSITEIFAGGDQDEDKIATKALFEAGLQDYLSHNFAEASVAFQKVVRQNPADVTASWYLRSCARYMGSGVSEEWEGTIEP